MSNRSNNVGKNKQKKQDKRKKGQAPDNPKGEIKPFAERMAEESKARNNSVQPVKTEEEIISENSKVIEEEVEKRVKARLEELDNEISSKKEELRLLGDDLKSKNDELTKQYSELEAAKISYHTEVSKLENEKLVYKNSILDEIGFDHKKLEDEIATLRNTNKNLMTDKEDLQDELDDVSNLYKKYKDNLANKTSELISKESEIETYKVYEKLYKEKSDDYNKLFLIFEQFGKDPKKVLDAYESLKIENKKLEDRIADYNSYGDLDELRKKSIEFDNLEEECMKLRSENEHKEIENKQHEHNMKEAEILRYAIKNLEMENKELLTELKSNVEKYNSRQNKIFSNLSEIDNEEVTTYDSILSSEKLSLKDLCTRFKGYLANRKNKVQLYYDDATIRTFIAGFASSRLMILEGLSGTGKSSLPRAFADFVGCRVKEVPVQSSWKDRNDLLGFYNDFKKQYKETEFLKALYTATHDSNNIYCIVLDEMNLSRIEYYFADLLSVLEKPEVDDWKIELISDFASLGNKPEDWPNLIHKGALQICDNTWFIGTANKDDSTFTITDKVYDRSVILNFNEKGKKDSSLEPASPIRLNNTDFKLLLDRAVRSFKEADKKRFVEINTFLDSYMRENFELTFGNRIANQLEKFVPVYVECGGTVDEAIDIMFSRKVLRKLGEVYDDSVKSLLSDFDAEIEKKRYRLPLTRKNIDKLVRNN